MSSLPPEVQQQVEDSGALGPVIASLITAMLAQMAAGKTAEEALKAVGVPLKVLEALGAIARRALFLHTQGSPPSLRSALYENTEVGVKQAIKDGVRVLEEALKHVGEKSQNGGPAVQPYEDQKRLATRVAQTVRNSALVNTALAAESAPEQGQEQGGGLKISKVWNSVRDDRTRVTHAVLGSKAYEFHEVSVMDQFVTIDGDHLMFPGDPSAPLDEIAGCRCWATVHVV